MIAVALGVGVVAVFLVGVAWGWDRGRRGALGEATMALRDEAQRQALSGQAQESFALRLGAFVVEQLEHAPRPRAGAWRGET